MFRRRIYISMFLILLAAVLIPVLAPHGKAEVSAGYTRPMIPSAWRSVMANDMNALTPAVVSDGVQVASGTVLPYVSAGLEVMLPFDMITDTIHALAIRMPDGTLVIYRGDKEVLMDPTTDEVTINGESGIVGGAVITVNETPYVSASFLARVFDLDYVFDSAERMAVFSGIHDSEILPTAFSLESVGRIPAVRDQGDLGACWAFASLSALESSLLPERNTSFVQDHLLLNHSMASESVAGASQMALSYMISWRGPVTDESDVYGDGIVNTELEPSVHVQGANTYENPSAEELKEAVFLYGGTEASLYFILADEQYSDTASRYFSDENSAYAYTGEREVNHDVIIVGWDDNYDRMNFPNGATLMSDGAFLCLNSWGEDFGMNGLMWISYCSTQFAKTAMCFTDVESTANYSRVYQSDRSGATANAGYGNDTAYFANVYTALGDEELLAAGIYTLGDDTDYEMFIVHDFEDDKSLMNRESIGEGRIAHTGYHTIRAKKEVQLKAGERFAVVIRITTPGLTHPVAIEKKTEAVPGVDIGDGEGYLSNRGSFFKRTEEASDCNVCLKVYTARR